ncbi:hypothetical protein LNP80_11245 [Chryseobacterium sp. C-39]|uniref:Uncharacterized protein n=1 Tax=Chryseobacterium muglaense TaxID=2893752 RepID=A0A9Q3YRH5_9FLAO|nr:hypothetical protein [Chryseobacterium muglaense]MBD3903749.1 hypothetical protein [Chryseobacterium muglaense]MCC9034824.1 hypothetical protein [Chryseobacterium muglaense]
MSLLKIFLIGLFLCSKVLFAQHQYQLKKDSHYIKNFQIEFIAEKNYLYISDEGFVQIPIEHLHNASKIKITDLDDSFIYDLYPEELKNSAEGLIFSTGKVIETVIIGNTKELTIGIDNKGALTNLYTIPEKTVIVEVPLKDKGYENKKIKKLRYYFTGGYNSLYKVKSNNNNIRITPILYTCESVNCLDKKKIIPEIEIGYTKKNKYLEVDLNHYNIIIDESSENLYVGYTTLDYFVVKQKKTKKIGDNKCYNSNIQAKYYKEDEYSCPVISIIIQ